MSDRRDRFAGPKALGNIMEERVTLKITHGFHRIINRLIIRRLHPLETENDPRYFTSIVIARVHRRYTKRAYLISFQTTERNRKSNWSKPEVSAELSDNRQKSLKKSNRCRVFTDHFMLNKHIRILLFTLKKSVGFLCSRKIYFPGHMQAVNESVSTCRNISDVRLG